LFVLLLLLLGRFLLQNEKKLTTTTKVIFLGFFIPIFFSLIKTKKSVLRGDASTDQGTLF